MQAIGLEDYLNDPMLLNDLISRLPCDLRLDWGKHRMSHARVDIALFDEWLFNLATCASQVTPIEHSNASLYSSEERKGRRKTSRERVMLHDLRRSEVENCPRCSKTHTLSDCGEFKAMSIDMMWKFIRDNKLCIRCFKRNFVRRCNSKRKCTVDGCKMPHNILLHSPHGNIRPLQVSEPKDNLSRNQTVLFHAKEKKCAIFRYIAVTLQGKLGSQLGLDGAKEELCLQWTGEVTQNEANSKYVALHISARSPSSRKFLIKGVRTVTSLNLPIQTLEGSAIMRRNHLKDLPMEPYIGAQARILIGLDNIKLGVPIQIREQDGDDLIAAECKLGWSVCGRNYVGGTFHQRVMHVCTCSSDSSIEELVKSHYAVESIGIKEVPTLLSKEDERSQRIMDLTTKYLPSDKRWETGLLWKHDYIHLPESQPMAMRRLLCLEKRMAKDPNLKSFLVDTIKQYEEKGYVRKLRDGEVLAGPKSWYIPIFTVTNPRKNKTRLVWDAAAAVGKTALNSVLLKGPDLMKSLLGILIRFREKPIGLCGDIREMFHQIRIRQEDQTAQKFLGREGDTSKQPNEYVMQVMTFGATCSPSLANYVKNKNAARFEAELPCAVKAILDNTFVDDWLQSVETEDEMIELAKTVRFIHSDGGFEMRSWKSNSRKVLLAITGQSTQNDKYIEEPLSRHEKVLGMWWSPAEYVLTFFENFPQQIYDENHIPTKRQMLCIIMTVFDPLGLLGFHIISAKILMQEVWRSGVSWDEPVRIEQKDKWWKWIRCMPAIAKIRVRRCDPLVSGGERIQLHTFVDASVDAYAAVVYLREEKGSIVSCCLVASKTRVAPLKPLSIPRLELMGAILGLRLSKFISEELSIFIEKRVFWTDSKNVLCWIKSDARKFHQFVAVRVGEILENSRVDEWRWVPSGDNVADEGTKMKHDIEFNGAARW
ncbi:uncharacterized protein [Eurosta solidaginis]|uniref:uncharacterized protein n=1 Tax=Eurosta solidaginis TaxID=178769 RepID=UPI00353070C9